MLNFRGDVKDVQCALSFRGTRILSQTLRVNTCHSSVIERSTVTTGEGAKSRLVRNHAGQKQEA